MDARDETGHVIATYREIAVHFRLKGPVQARVKAKRAGWPSEAQNHPGDPLRIRVPQGAWNQGSHRSVESATRPPRNLRNPPSPTPDIKNEIGDIIRGFETALETLRKQQIALEGQLKREQERADRLERERDVKGAELAAWTAGGPLARAVRAFLNRRGRA
jgi:hypothetical protein